MPKKRKDGYIRSSFTFQKKRYYVYGKNKQELFEKEREKREELEKHYDSRFNPSIQEYYERWIERRKGTVTASTINADRTSYAVISSVKIQGINRKFPEMLMRDITIDDLLYLQRTLIESGRKTKTVNNAIVLIRKMFNLAEKENIIQYNPCRLLKDLKRTEEEARNTIHRALTREEQALLFGCPVMKSSTYYNVYRLAILTGMRIGEIGALKVSDIKNGMIHVTRTLTTDENRKVIIGKDAKTASGRRLIPLTEQIKSVINDQKERIVKTRNNIIRMDDLLFLRPNGTLMSARDPDRELTKICKAAEIEKISMHCFRATFATRCIENNMNPRTLQEILGHKDYAITMNLYGHVLNDTKTKEMDKVEIVI